MTWHSILTHHNYVSVKTLPRSQSMTRPIQLPTERHTYSIDTLLFLWWKKNDKNILWYKEEICHNNPIAGHAMIPSESEFDSMACYDSLGIWVWFHGMLWFPRFLSLIPWHAMIPSVSEFDSMACYDSLGFWVWFHGMLWFPRFLSLIPWHAMIPSVSEFEFEMKRIQNLQCQW